ncbi:uncharacterized protein LOC110659213 [Hevea brasiliensis]|uniref:uncharacterized protein LOC110659213 n=1 Tax=Hevea brasiliensis TaxID=3981 RepID=UPI0025DC9733|nr:uncharacterized protein LOC110659213 [Hevea brasiliensis]
MAMGILVRRLSRGSTTLQTVVSLRHASWRLYSKAFREERDTFGPIQVRADKFVFLLSKFSGCGVHKLKDHCKILKLAASVSRCRNQSFVPLEFLRSALSSIAGERVVWLDPSMGKAVSKLLERWLKGS